MSDNKSKIKVVWICHFSNPRIQEHLVLSKSSPQFAPWITLLIEEFRKIKEIELHVISPFNWLKKDTNFELDGVYYYFFKTGIPFIHRHWPVIFKFDYWTKFFFNRRKIKSIVDNIQPDIINLHGVENPYYSTAIFDLKKYPVLISIQGLFSFSNFITKNFIEKMRLSVEQKILTQFNNFGIRVKFLADYIISKNANARFFWYKYPFKRNAELAVDSISKTYDVVFFAKLSKDKGIEDLIKAIRIVKGKNASISVKIIGTANEIYFSFLRKLVVQLELETNIEFLGFMPTQQDVHTWVSKAKICVLPTYNDILPGTIIESLFLKVPVIAYAANGVMDLNFEGEIIRLVEVGNVDELANQISLFLDNDKLRENFSLKGFEYAIKNFDNQIEAHRMVAAYQKVISDFRTQSK